MLNTECSYIESSIQYLLYPIPHIVYSRAVSYCAVSCRVLSCHVVLCSMVWYIMVRYNIL